MSNWKTTKCCGTCALWDIERAKTKSGAVQGGVPARCLWASTELRPEALRNHMQSSLTPGFITRDEGSRCQCHIPRGTVNSATINAKHLAGRIDKEK